MSKPRIIRYKPAAKRRKALDRLNHPLLALTALVGFVWLANYSLHYQPPRRLNCQDLGLCNLKTGEVYGVTKPKPAKQRKPTMTQQEVNAAMVQLFDPEGNEL